MSGVAARAATLGVFLAWSLLAVGDAENVGFYSVPAIILVVAGFVVLVAVVASGGRLAVPGRRELVIPVGVAMGAALFHGATRYMYMGEQSDLVVRRLFVVLCGVVLYSLLVRSFLARRATTIAAAGLAVATAGVIIGAASAPAIDVWHLLQQSSSGLLHGHNMYRQHWTDSNGLTDVYPYFPGTTLLLAPFKWLLGDVRFGTTAACLVAAYLVHRLSPEAPVALGFLIVIAPHWAFLIDQSWTEPLLVATLAGALLAIRSERHGWAIACLAVAVATKQHIVVLLPLFAVWPSFGLRRTIKSAGIAIAVSAPWIIASPSAFWHDAVRAELDLPVQPQGLDLPAIIVQHGSPPGFWLLALVVGGAYALALWRVPRTVSGLALAAALVMYAFDLANKQSHFNHYALPLGLLVIAVAAAVPEPRQSNSALQPSGISVEA